MCTVSNAVPGLVKGWRDISSAKSQQIPSYRAAPRVSQLALPAVAPGVLWVDGMEVCNTCSGAHSGLTPPHSTLLQTAVYAPL